MITKLIYGGDGSKSTKGSEPKTLLELVEKIDNGIPQLHHDNNVHVSDTEVLNRYFQSVFMNEDTSNLQ